MKYEIMVILSLRLWNNTDRYDHFEQYILGKKKLCNNFLNNLF